MHTAEQRRQRHDRANSTSREPAFDCARTQNTNTCLLMCYNHTSRQAVSCEQKGAAMKPMNGTKPRARDLIDRIMADERLLSSSHFSDRVYSDEPILTTGNRMAAYLPDAYREMRSISRWEPGEDGANGRWLSEAELFYRQGILMADHEDDCPYHGNFKSYFPTYNAMSDRQLRGYFTWRTEVRKGNIQETSLSFAYVYLYELINGIGVESPREGFERMQEFWRAYRAFAPEMDRFASVWIQDFVVYHGLPSTLLKQHKTLLFDHAITTLRRVDDIGCEYSREQGGQRRRKGMSALPLPCREHLENELIQAIDALSTYNLSGSRLYKEMPDALRHVACSVYVRTSEYYRKQRKNTLLESWFGEEVSLPYTMFGSAVFHEAEPHADTMYQLSDVHRYRCHRGMWTCERIHGSRSRSPKLGACMRATDRMLREALGYEYPLKETKDLPKYLTKFIEDEVSIWVDWQAAHAPRVIEFDLSQLAGIRSAAEATRESLLIDEEREGTGAYLDAHVVENAIPQAPRVPPREVDVPPMCDSSAHPLTPLQNAYMAALLSGDSNAAHRALDQMGASEDLAIDALNDALFGLFGDTVIEFGQNGPLVIEDYREDVEGLLTHD